MYSLCAFYPSVASTDAESLATMTQLVRSMSLVDDKVLRMMADMTVWRRYYDPFIGGQGKLDIFIITQLDMISYHSFQVY